jgi:DNA-binding NarL/FixJ family response regulator
VPSGNRDGKTRRSYRPAVEALEALRMLSGAAQALPDLAAAHDVFLSPPPIESSSSSVSDAAWDEALGQTRLADILGPSAPEADSGAISSGLVQLNRYLSRAWYRAGVAVQMHDDCSQAVYVTLLQNLGRSRFDSLLGEIGQVGIRDVLSRETADGPDFFRAIDTVKKRAQRERSFQPLDSVVAAGSATEEDSKAGWRSALQEAIDQSLNPREAALIYATLKGETPAEIASQWGVAPKTVSNEKTRVIQKLRDALTADVYD